MIAVLNYSQDRDVSITCKIRDKEWARINAGTDFNSTARGPSDVESFARRFKSFVRTSCLDKQTADKHKDGWSTNRNKPI